MGRRQRPVPHDRTDPAAPGVGADDRAPDDEGSPEDLPDGSAEDPTAGDVAVDDLDVLREQLFFQSKRQRRDMRRLPTLLWSAIQMVWRTNRRATAGTVALQLSGALVASLQVLLAGYAVKLLLQGGNDVSAGVLIAVLLLAVVTFVGGLAGSGGGLMGRLLGHQIERRITDDVLDVANRVPLVAYDDPVFYNQLNRVLSNVPLQPFQVVSSVSSLVGGVAGAIALVISLVVLSPVLAVVVLASGVPMLYFARRGGNAEFQFAVEQTVNVREREYLQGLMTRREGAAEARAYATSVVLRQRFRDFYDAYIANTGTLIRRRYLLAAGSALASSVAVSVAMALLYVFIRDGAFTVAQAASGLVAIRLLSSRMNLLVSGVSSLFQASLFLDDFDTFLNERVETVVEDADGPVAHDPHPVASVHLRGVRFVYPSGTVPALVDLDLDIRPGEVVAVVGENGSGKTTLAKLIAGLYEPSEGAISWSGADGEPISRDEARGETTLVLQEFARYQFSVRDNIGLGRPERPASEEEIHAAVRAAGLDDMVSGLSSGLDTRLSRQFDGGRELSLGQWQRLALARAFYRQGSLVVFDEPAASLDPRGERRLYDSVRELLRGRTVILITHRMQSVRTADRIIVMAHGEVVEDGDHESLMQAHGLYAELVGLQETSGLQRATPITSA